MLICKPQIEPFQIADIRLGKRENEKHTSGRFACKTLRLGKSGQAPRGHKAQLEPCDFAVAIEMEGSCRHKRILYSWYIFLITSVCRWNFH